MRLGLVLLLGVCTACGQTETTADAGASDAAAVASSVSADAAAARRRSAGFRRRGFQVLEKLEAAATAAGARTLYYMPWGPNVPYPASTQRFEEATGRWVEVPIGSSRLGPKNDGLHMSIERDYRPVAAHFAAYLAPAGIAFREYWHSTWDETHDIDAANRLFPRDVHPSKSGGYLVAAPLYARLTGTSPEGLGDGGSGLQAEDLIALQSRAWVTYSVLRDAHRDCQGPRCIQFVDPP